VQKVVSFIRREKDTVTFPTLRGEGWEVLLRSIRGKKQAKDLSPARRERISRKSYHKKLERKRRDRYYSHSAIELSPFANFAYWETGAF